MDKLAAACGLDPGRDPAAQRDGDRRPADHRPGRSRTSRRSPGASARRPRCRCPTNPSAASTATRCACRAAPAAPPTPATSAAASASRVSIKNLMYSEGFDDYSTARCRLADGVATLKFATAEVGQGFVTHRRADRPRRARRRRGAARADRHRGRLGRLDVGVAPDVDERRRRRRRLPRRCATAVRARRRGITASTPRRCRSTAPTSSTSARRAAGPGRRGDRRAARSTRPSSTTTAPTEDLDENGQGNCHTAFAFVAHRAVVDVDLELGLVKVVQIATAQDVGRALNPL